MDKPANSCPRCNSRHLKDFNSMARAEKEEFIAKFTQIHNIECSHGKCCPDCGWTEGQDNRDVIRRGARGSRDKREKGENENPNNSSVNPL